MSTAARMAVGAEPVIQHRSSHSKLQTVIFSGVFGLLLFGPLAFGATEEWAIFVIELGSATLFLIWAVWQILSAELHIKWNPLFAPMLAFSGLVILQLV